MGAETSIGDLVMRLRMDVRDLEKAVGTSTSQLGKLDKASDDTERRVSASGRRIGLAFGAAAAVIAASVKRAVDEINELKQVSVATGIAMESLSALKFATTQAGGDFGALTGAIRTFQETLSTISRGEVSAGTQALHLLGLSARDAATGGLRDFGSVLPEVADRLSQMQNGFQKTQLVTALFGEQATKLIPLLNQGGEAIRRQVEEQKKANNVTPESIEQSQKYRAALDQLSNSWNELGKEVAGFLAGPAKGIADFFTQGIKDTRNYFGTQLPLEQWRANFDRAAASVAQLREQVDATRQKLEELRAEKVLGAGGLFIDRNIEKTEEKLDGLEHRLVTALAKMQDFGRELELQRPAEPKLELPPLQLLPPASLDALAVARAELDALMDRLHGLPVLMGQAFDFDTRPFEEAMGRVDDLMRKKAIGDQQGTALKLRLQRSEQDEILNTASLAASTLTAVFGKSKLAAIGSAIINTAVGVTKALSASAPPYNFINAALVAASGAAQIAAIRSTTESGGGAAPSVSGGGGSGGGDTPTSPAPEPRSLIIENVTASGLYTASAVRDLIERINAEIRDGAVLVVR